MNQLAQKIYNSILQTGYKFLAILGILAILAPATAQAVIPVIIIPAQIPGYNPIVQNLVATPDPFVLGVGQVKFEYKISIANAVNVTTTVYSKTAPNIAVMTWKGVNNSGVNSVVWDGLDDTFHKFVAAGDYQFKIAVAAPAETQTLDFKVQINNCVGFSDIKTTDKDCKAVEYVKNLGVMTGNPDGTFTPDSNLQRDQIAKIVLNTFKLFDPKQDYCLSNNPFPDVTSNDWAYQYICRGKALKIITGYLSGVEAGLYLPAKSVNRVEFLALVLRNLPNNAIPPLTSISYTDVTVGSWYSGYAKYAQNHNLFTGSKMYPDNAMLRREVARALYTLHNEGEL